ncbi:sialoadhesin [Gadus chalcogrammus]|uniref:sialoadhesin n=1 Tax=Gadus chalcogrammus TaxID=1042646 RepID=UPI0024C49806|nr:sialoadhesin [Gadus chalcogrammus]
MILVDFFMLAGALSWTAAGGSSPVPSVPGRVRALAGSCVVVPCSFTPLAAPLRRGGGRVEVRLKFTGGRRFLSRSTAFNSEDPRHVAGEYLRRTSLHGRISEGDCSLRLEPVRLQDSRAFEVALKGPEDWYWGTPRAFTLEVSEHPESPVISGPVSVTEGQPVSLNCTVGSFCPSRPPVLRWHWERGAPPNSSSSDGGGRQLLLQRQPHRPLLLSSLSFTASSTAKPRVRCEAAYPGGAVVGALREVHITFAPREVRVEVRSLVVHEGGSVLLECACKADPPVTTYRWSYVLHGHTVALDAHTHAARIYNATRGTLVRCSAHNLIGRGDSRPTPLDIQYKPLILRLLSSCLLAEFEVTCVCIVNSNPRAAVRWSVNGSVPSGGYNVSVEGDSSEVRSWLRWRMDGWQRVTCLAENQLGDDSLTLMQPGEVSSPWWLVAVVAVCVPACTSSLLLLYCCRRRKRVRRVLNRHRGAYLRDMAVKTPLYINCTEVTHVYCNGSYQLVYQNATPLFVRTNQARPIGRRGGERRMRARRERGRRDRATRRETSSREETETAIYVEIL